MTDSEKLLVIVGPTASGKTALSINIAKKFNGEIICADSRTLYKDMNIGTAKPTVEEMSGVPHHMLDIINPDQKYNVASFQGRTLELIKDISKRGKLPILVGGSGLYIDSVIFGYKFSSGDMERDPINPRHLKSPGNKQDKLRENTLVLGINPGKEVLKERIIKRMDKMLNEGFEDELRSLVNKYGWDAPGMLAPGYRAFRSYVEGEASLEEAKERFVLNDMQLAKRQRSWFKRNENILWLEDLTDAERFVQKFVSSK